MVADIGDGSLGLSLVLLSGTIAEVVISMRATLPIEERSHEQSTVAIAKLLEETLTKLLAANAPGGAKPAAPESIYAIIRSPWTRSRTAKAEEAFPETRSITKDAIAEEAKKALSQPSELDRANILEAGVLQVFLNGYHTHDPLNKKAQSISVVAFESDLDAALRSSIVEVFGKLLPGRTPVFHSGMRALLAVMHEHLPDAQRFMLLDIGGTTSACTVVRKDAITQHAVVTEGLTTLIKRVAPTGLPEETLSSLRMLASDTCSTAACQAIKDSLAKAEPELVRAFGEVFASLAANRRLPNAAILSAPSEMTPWLQGFFSRIDFSQFTATTKPLVVEPLSPEHFLDTVHWQTGVTPDTGLGVAAAAVNILAHER